MIRDESSRPIESRDEKGKQSSPGSVCGHPAQAGTQKVSVSVHKPKDIVGALSGCLEKERCIQGPQ